MQTKNYLLSHLPSFVKNGTGAGIYQNFWGSSSILIGAVFFKIKKLQISKNTSYRRENIENLITVV